MKCFVRPVAFSSLLLACAFASAQDIRPGRYQTTATMNVAGPMGKPMIDEDCITRKDIEDGLTRVGIEKDSQCKVLGLKRSPGHVSYQLACAEDGVKTTGDVKGTMTADSFEFDIVTTAPERGARPMNLKVKGKRIGECK